MTYDTTKFRLGEWTVVPIDVAPDRPLQDVMMRVTKVDAKASTITIEVAPPRRP